MFTPMMYLKYLSLRRKINHPNAQENENFGRALAFDKFLNSVTETGGTRNPVISSDKASTLLSVGYDNSR